jgi:hypothetical protein
MRAHSSFFRRAYRFARGLVQTVSAFQHHARAEKKCAASPGGTFFILLPDLALSTQRPIRLDPDSIAPQPQILTEKLLVAGRGAL